MPKCFEAYGYIIFFWSNEGYPMEPIHVHIGKKISANSTKIWILSDGSAEVANNNSRIPLKDLRKILKIIEVYSDMIVAKWQQYFGEKALFKDQLQ
ncbi:DUF4160 domain-containing protein [Oribacterium sp. HCP28S3_H8]|uniref:DUF4160 domain-containing protein n=1 Tax=Oribacterium sp. HCP28S3_H8 TaxID=3438945 RepID=UPI003F896B7F